MAGDESESEAANIRKLDQTATWAVAAVCAAIIIISVILEKVLHKVGQWLRQRHKLALFEALEKVKAELMVLGFISLLLTFGERFITGICIPVNAANTMLPCPYRGSTGDKEEEHHRRLLSYERRLLASVDKVTNCKKGYEPLISSEGIHQLHIFIFFLAVFHVAYSALTMMLGRLKIRGWKGWEQETSSHDYEYKNDMSRFRFTHETSFVKAHTSFWTRIPIFFYVGCFFRQFFWSISKADYLTMRHGFITVHLAPGSKFNFQKYIKRSLEDDFKVVVGVSPALWASVVIFLLLNVSGWQALFWASMIPLLIILAVGTKLQAIMTKMALEIQERNVVVQGIPLVQVGDKYFWFGSPKLILYLIHFTLFQNAFQITYFLWIWYEFELKKACFHENFNLVIVRVALGVGVQVLCSYITLPLYSLVTQMGSNMKRSVFDEQTNKAIRQWRQGVKKKQRGRKGRSSSPGVSTMGQALHRFKTTGHSSTIGNTNSYHNMSDAEVDLIPDADFHSHDEEEHHDEADFSFPKANQLNEP